MLRQFGLPKFADISLSISSNVYLKENAFYGKKMNSNLGLCFSFEEVQVVFNQLKIVEDHAKRLGILIDFTLLGSLNKKPINRNFSNVSDIKEFLHDNGLLVKEALTTYVL